MIQALSTEILHTPGVCLYVCLCPINVKTSEPIRPKFCVGSRVIPGKVYGWPNFQKFKNFCQISSLNRVQNRGFATEIQNRFPSSISNTGVPEVLSENCCWPSLWTLNQQPVIFHFNLRKLVFHFTIKWKQNVREKMAFSSLRNSVPDSSQSDVTILSNPKDYQVYLWSSQPGPNLSLLPTYLWKVLKENSCDFSLSSIITPVIRDASLKDILLNLLGLSKACHSHKQIHILILI